MNYVNSSEDEDVMLYVLSKEENKKEVRGEDSVRIMLAIK